MNTQAVICGIPVIETVPNEELLRFMAVKNEYPDAARQAFEEFDRRHRDYLKKCIHKIASTWRSLIDEDAEQDFVQEALLRAFEKAHTFKGQGFQDEAAERKWARAWLGTIATNLLRDWLRTRKVVKFEDLDDDKINHEVECKLSSERYGRFQRSPESELRHEAFGSLSEREQAVLRIYGVYAEFDDLQFSAPGEEQNKQARRQLTISDKELDELARNLSTSKGNIRQIKHRAIEKIKRYVQSHAHQKGMMSDHEQRGENTGTAK